MVTKPDIGQGRDTWGTTLNAALDDLQGQVTANGSSIATNTANVTALQSASTGLVSAAAYGLLGWTHDPASVGTGQLLTNGTLYLSRINVGASGTVTKLFWGINSGGVSPTAGQNFVGLYDSTGTRLVSVGVDARVTSTGLFTENVSQAVTPGYYWFGMLFNAGTAPQVYRSQSLNATLANTNLSASQARWATNGTGLTALPASITPASNTVSQNALYAAIG